MQIINEITHWICSKLFSSPSVSLTAEHIVFVSHWISSNNVSIENFSQSPYACSRSIFQLSHYCECSFGMTYRGKENKIKLVLGQMIAIRDRRPKEKKSSSFKSLLIIQIWV